MTYKAFAVWGDPRLPVLYSGAADENVGDRVMRDIAEHSAALSGAALATLSPFYLQGSPSRGHRDDMGKWHHQEL